MSDLISRQAAIDELDKGAWGVEWDKTLAKTMIESLPSAQFTQNTQVNSNNALDTISRQAVFDMANGWTYNFCDQEDEWAAMKEIRELPSAEPERKTGRWINHGQYADFFPHCEYRCSVCDHPYLEIEIAYNFCPNCGADMRGGEGAVN